MNLSYFKILNKNILDKMIDRVCFIFVNEEWIVDKFHLLWVE